MHYHINVFSNSLQLSAVKRLIPKGCDPQVENHWYSIRQTLKLSTRKMLATSEGADRPQSSSFCLATLPSLHSGSKFHNDDSRIMKTFCMECISKGYSLSFEVELRLK